MSNEIKYASEVSVDDIINGNVVGGEIMFICDYRFNDMSNKAIRKIFPTKVVLESRGGRHSGYVGFVFIGLNAKGKIIKSKVYRIYDNTYGALPIRIFKDLKDCNDCFSVMCNKVIEDSIVWLNDIGDKIALRVEEIEDWEANL